MKRPDKKTSAKKAAPTAAAQPGGQDNNGLNEKLHRLELITELFNICNSTSNLNELMDRVFKKVVQDVGAEAGSLWMVNDDGTEITCHVAEGPTRDKVTGMTLPAGSGVVGYVIEKAESRTVFDASKDAQFANSVDQKTGFTTRSMICAPLIVENDAIGALQLLNKKTVDGKFDNSDLNLLRMLCQSSATPIVNARLRSSEQKVQELSILLEISKEITGTLDLNSCMLSVVNLCSKLIPYDRAVIALNEKERIKISAISGQMTVNNQDPDIVNLQTMLDGVSKKGEDIYIQSGKKYLKGDTVAPYLETYIKRYHPGTLAVYRLFDDESDLGLFMMESTKENLITSSQFSRIELLKNMMTVALRNAQLYNTVPSLSVFNSLTGGKRFSLRKIGITVSVLISAALVLWFIRPPYNVSGKFEIQPQQKYVLYSSLDNAVVSAIQVDPAEQITKGDTLLFFDNKDLHQDLFNKENDMVMLKQTIGTLRQQQKHSEYHTKRLELKKAELEATSLRRKISQSYVTAPVNGRLMNDDITNLVGQRFSKGDELFEIIPTGTMRLKLLVPEREIFRIKNGQPCNFRVPAFPGRTFSGEVQQLAFDVENEESIFYPVLVTVHDSSSLLLPGMSGKGKIKTEKRSLLSRLLSKPREYLAIKLWL